MKEMPRVELYERIRHDSRVEGLSVRGLAKKYGVHRRTVREALECAVPPERKVAQRTAPVLTAEHRATVRRWLTADLTAPRKQRHTARRVFQRLVAEQGAAAAESTVRAFVAQVRDELVGGVGLVSVPQTHVPGAEAEVDFGEFQAWVAGVLTRLWMFVLRLSYSGRAVHVVYGNQATESFLDGFVVALDRLGVPDRIRCDNLKPAVIRVLLGRERLENPRFVALRSHYGFDAFYCLPGIKGAHEKGGVEGEIGRFRRTHLVPVPEVASIEELNEICERADAAEDGRRIGAATASIGANCALEAARLRPALAGFDAATLLSCRVDAKARVVVRQSYYSVPAHLSGRRVAVRLTARTVEAVEGTRVLARHPRSLHKGTESLTLDHYLEVLVRKPGALAGSTPLAAARAAGVFTDAHERFWIAARRKLGDQAGTRALVEVLLLHRTLPGAAIGAGIEAVLGAGSLSADAVALEARRAVAPPTAAAVAVPIGVRETARPAPSLAGYDQLLARAAR